MIKPANCCNACTKLASKYNYDDKIFTFDNDSVCSAISDSPGVSLGYKIFHNI